CPSQSRVAKSVGVSRRQIIDTVEVLRDTFNVLQIVKRSAQHQQATYRIALPDEARASSQNPQLNRARREPEFTQTKETEIQLLSAVAGATEKEEFQKLKAELIGIYSSLWRERPADRVLDAGDRKLLRLLLKKYTPERLKAIYRLCFGFEKNSAN